MISMDADMIIDAGPVRGTTRLPMLKNALLMHF